MQAMQLKKPQLELESEQACRGGCHTLPCITNCSEQEETYAYNSNRKGPLLNIRQEEEDFSPPHGQPNQRL